MRIVAKRTLRTYWERERGAEQPLRSWYAIAAQADWSSPADVKAVYRNASIVRGNRVVFNIGGNRYRLIVRFDYARRIGFVRFVGTHVAYDRIDASTVQEVDMVIKPIRNEADYDEALKTIDGLMGAAPNTPDGDTLEVLATLVEAYEAERWPMETPDPVSMIEHVMEARGLLQKDLAALIGSQPRASEILNRHRPLTLPMIRALAREWKLPADTLVGEYDLARGA